MSFISWLFKGAGANKTTFAAILGIIGGLGLIFNGNFNEGAMLAIISAQQLFTRWVKSPGEFVFFQRTFWASLGGVFTAVYMISQGNMSEGLLLLMASLQALFQRQAVGKKIV